jgi:hypothetical protein
MRSSTTYRGFVRGKTIELDETLPFSEGQAVSVAVQPIPVGSSPGSPETILHGMCQPPHLRSQDVDELERMIEGARLPIRDGGIFDDTE